MPVVASTQLYYERYDARHGSPSSSSSSSFFHHSNNNRHLSSRYNNNGRIVRRTHRRRQQQQQQQSFSRQFLLASASSTSVGRSRVKRERNNKQQQAEEHAVVRAYGEQQDEEPPLNYSDLTLLGRVVAGTVEVGVIVVMEYISGFVGGYFLGAVTDIPRFLIRPAILQQQQQRSAANHFLRELAGRTVRMHGKSLRWAKNWAVVSAAFGGFRVGTKVMRGGVEDEWTTILSSMAAGAFFARKDGPMAMVQGAVLYGGMMYLMSGRGVGRSKEPFEYQEKLIDF